MFPQFQCPNCRAYSDLTADVDVAQSDIDEWMENTDDQAHQDGSANEETHSVVDVPDSHTNGNTVDGAGDDLGDSVINETEADVTTSDIIQDGHAATVSSPIEIPSNVHSAATMRNAGLLSRRVAGNSIAADLHSVNSNTEQSEQSNEDTMDAHHEQTRIQTPDPDLIISGEGPLTPRNNAGPFVFDGSAGRSDAGRLEVPGIPEVTEANGSSSS